MRHTILDPRCSRCRMKRPLCICADLPSVTTRTRISLVVHKLERMKSTNTGLLAAACLTNCEIHPFGHDLPRLVDTPWPADHQPAVLFPSVDGPRVDTLLRFTRPVCLIILDGTWQQAAKIRRHFATRAVPFVALPPGPPSTYRVRTEHQAGGLSTLEAIARALTILEGNPVAEERLLDAQRRAIDRILWTRGALRREEVYGGLPAELERHALNATTEVPPTQEPGTQERETQER